MASTNDAERNRVFSFQAALMSIGGFMGAWFSGRLSGFFINQFGVSSDSPWPYTWTLLAAAGLAVVGVVASLFLVEAQTGRTQSVAEDAGERRVVEDPFPWKMILIVAVVISLRIVGELSARNFSNLYLDINFSLNPARIAYIFSVAQLFAVPAPLLAPMLMSRFGRHAVFNWATAGVAGCVVLMAMAGHWIMVAISYFFLLSLAQIARPAITIISMSSVTPKWQASMSSSNLIAIGLSGLAASLMAGLMIGSIGFRAFYLTAAAITLAGVVVFWFNFLKGQEAQ
jgi:predicted MFS family arabinose efflux permease